MNKIVRSRRRDETNGPHKAPGALDEWPAHFIAPGKRILFAVLKSLGGVWSLRIIESEQTIYSIETWATQQKFNALRGIGRNESLSVSIRFVYLSICLFICPPSTLLSYSRLLPLPTWIHAINRWFMRARSLGGIDSASARTPCLSICFGNFIYLFIYRHLRTSIFLFSYFRYTSVQLSATPRFKYLFLWFLTDSALTRA